MEKFPNGENSEKEKRKRYFDNVALTEEEVEKAISDAKRTKFGILERQRKNDEYQARLEEAKRPFTPRELQTFVLERANLEIITDRKIIFNEESKAIFKALCYYFANDIEFESMGDGFSLNKGICLMGNIGTGKTSLMRMFERNKKQSYTVISCRKVAGDYAENGHDALDIYSELRNNYTNEIRYFLQPHLGFCFDDLGTEEIKKNFGNQVNVMEEIILNRYDNKHYGFQFTHLTTNLTADQIESIYGSRVRSRMREMFNVFHLNGNDLRM